MANKNWVYGRLSGCKREMLGLRGRESIFVSSKHVFMFNLYELMDSLLNKGSHLTLKHN